MNSVATTAVAGRLHGRAVKALLVVLALDVLFMVLHALHVVVPASTSVVWLARDGFGIDQDRGAAELYQYAKLTVVVTALLLWFVRDRALSALAWAAAFGYVLLDDAVQVHERGGWRFATMFELEAAFGLRSEDFGELLVWAVVGTVLGTAVLVAHQLARSAERRISRALMVLFALLMLCGLVFDMVHVMVMETASLDLLMTLAEDGGELLVVSLVLFVVFSSRFMPAAGTAAAATESPEPRRHLSES